jgi:ABC-type bacteriocin/lantibiotic exporter with double-glycine peptidase domain
VALAGSAQFSVIQGHFRKIAQQICCAVLEKTMRLPPFAQWPEAAPRTSDRSVLSYTWRVIGMKTLVAAFLAALLAGVTLAPIDLERRIIDEISVGGPFSQIAFLGGLYLGFNLLQQLMKAGLGTFQDWVIAALTANCRRDLIRASAVRKGKSVGQMVAVVTSETDNLAQFVGSGFSGAAADILIMLGFIGWMLVIERNIAMLSLTVFVPQIVFAIVIQRYLNRLNASRVQLLRDYANAAASGQNEATVMLIEAVARNQFLIGVLQQANKAIRNLLIALPVVLILTYGGWLVINGSTTIGTVVAFATGYRRLADPLRSLLDFYVDFQRAQVQFKLIAEWFGNNGEKLGAAAIAPSRS